MGVEGIIIVPLSLFLFNHFNSSIFVRNSEQKSELNYHTIIINKSPM